MPKTTKKTKGNRFDKVQYHVPFYTPEFFNPDGEPEEGEAKSKSKKGKTVKIPMRINASGDNSRDNVTTWELKGIAHFDNNVEEVLKTLSQLQERIIQPRAIEEVAENIKTTLQLMQLVCNSGPATQTLQEACRSARQVVFDKYIEEEDNDDIQEDILVNEEVAFFEFLDGQHDDVDEEEYEDEDAYREHLYWEFFRAFWNHLHSIIFGADAYRAFKQQKDYLLNKIIKPFGVTVEAVFRRVEVITNLMSYFPPPSSRGKTASQEQWIAFEDSKKISSELKREMKYNLLPESFHDRFDTLEVDWSEMTNSKFLAEAQKCESIDDRDRQKLEKAKELLKRKRQNDTDSTSTSTNKQAQKREGNSNKRSKTFQGSNPRKSNNHLCEFCKMAGAPTFVYLSHDTSDCNKKGDYMDRIKGRSTNNPKRENRKSEKDLHRELKILSRQIQKLKSSKSAKRKRNDDDSSISSMETDGFNN
jgi:hypothetical protein